MNFMYNHQYDDALARLNAGSINHVQFFKETDCYDQFESWCDGHDIKTDDENAAELFFDMHGFAESAEEIEFVEPVKEM